MTKRKPVDDSNATPTPDKRSRQNIDRHASDSQTNPSLAPQIESSMNLPPLPQISAAMSKVVFTHQSVVPHKDKANQCASYERLEFLGDAYIEVIATRLIWDKFKDLPAGRLSQIRELLVKNESLGVIAVQYGLDRKISAASDLENNPRTWAKIKGDLIEAYVAALVLEDDQMGGRGFIAAEKWLRELWIPKIEKMMEEKGPDLEAKVALSRKLVSRGVRLDYLELQPMEQLEGGQQAYFVGAYLTGWKYERQLLGRGQALTKSGAGNLAAKDALQNPLVEKIARTKIEFDGTTERRRKGGDVDQMEVRQQTTRERLTQERALVDKKRSMFLSSDFG